MIRRLVIWFIMAFQSIYNDELNAAFAQMKQDGKRFGSRILDTMVAVL